MEEVETGLIDNAHILPQDIHRCLIYTDDIWADNAKGSSVELVRSKHMNNACMAPEINDPMLMLMKVLNKIMSESVSPKAKARERALPIKGFTEPPSRLRKMGISLLVTLEDDETLKETVVPLRVDENILIAGPIAYSHEERSSWKGRQIHRISRRFFDSFDIALRKVKDCLKVAWHRFIRKINAGAKHARHRAQRGHERQYRFEYARICCH